VGRRQWLSVDRTENSVFLECRWTLSARSRMWAENFTPSALWMYAGRNGEIGRKCSERNWNHLNLWDGKRQCYNAMMRRDPENRSRWALGAPRDG
jgi:hypothetical protein